MTRKRLRAEIVEILHALSLENPYQDSDAYLKDAVDRLKTLATRQPNDPSPHCDACLVALGYLAKGTPEGRETACEVLLELTMGNHPARVHGKPIIGMNTAGDYPHGTGAADPVAAKERITQLARDAGMHVIDGVPNRLAGVAQTRPTDNLLAAPAIEES